VTPSQSSAVLFPARNLPPLWPLPFYMSVPRCSYVLIYLRIPTGNLM
jgi:hypothetical protein